MAISIGDIIKAADAVYKLVEQNKINHESAKLVADRVKSLTVAIEHMKSLTENSAAQEPLKIFLETIVFLEKLIKRFQGDNWLYRLAKTHRYKKEIADINDRLHRSEQDLLVGFVVDKASRDSKEQEIRINHQEWLEKTVKASQLDLVALHQDISQTLDLSKNHIESLESLEARIQEIPGLVKEALTEKESSEGSKKMKFKGVKSATVDVAAARFHYQYPEGISETDRVWLDKRKESDRQFTQDMLAMGVKARSIEEVEGDGELDFHYTETAGASVSEQMEVRPDAASKYSPHLFHPKEDSAQGDPQTGDACVKKLQGLKMGGGKA